MQRGLSKPVKKAVVKNRLQGLDDSENAKSTSSSPSGPKLTTEEVDSVVKEFDSEVTKKGLEATSKDYGVSGITKELSEIAKFKRENRVDYPSILEGTRVAGTLKKFGAGMPEFEQFLNSVYARSLEKGYTPNEIISQSSKLEALEKKYRMDFDALRASFEELGKSLAAKKKEKADLENEIAKRLEAEVSVRKKELGALEAASNDRIKKLDEKYSKQREEIQAYSELRALGIDGKRILSWNQIIKSANLDYGIIEGELRNQANLKSLEDKMDTKIKELVSEEIRLRQSISELGKEKETIESSIQTIKESALSGMEELRSKILSSISSLKESAEANLEETASESQKSLEELKGSSQQQIRQASEIAFSDMKTTIDELKSSAADFSKELKDSISQASTEIKNVGLALEAGEKIGKYRNILPLLQLIEGSGTQDESEALIAMWNLSSRFNAWLENQYPGEKKDISEPLTKLLESINNEIQRVGGV